MRSVEFYKLLVKNVGDLNQVAQEQSTGVLTTVAATAKVKGIIKKLDAELKE